MAAKSSGSTNRGGAKKGSHPESTQVSLGEGQSNGGGGQQHPQGKAKHSSAKKASTSANSSSSVPQAAASQPATPQPSQEGQGAKKGGRGGQSAKAGGAKAGGGSGAKGSSNVSSSSSAQANTKSNAAEEAARQQREAQRIQAEIEAQKAAEKRAEEERIRKEEEDRRRIEEEKRRIEEEKKRKEEEEMTEMKHFAALETKNRASLLALREANLRASAGNRPDITFFKSLNSTIAKCSAFAKRCNRITAETGESILKESKSLNLSKYVSEVATNIATCPLKPTDIEIAVLICSELHQKYADFSGELIPLLQKIIFTSDASGSGSGNTPSSSSSSSNTASSSAKETSSGGSPERRVALRLYTELFVAGIITDQPTLAQIIKEMLEIKDAKLLPATLQLVLSFVRSGGRDILGIISKTNEAKIDQCIAAGLLESSIKDPIPNLIAPERRTQFTNVVSAFYQKMSSVLVQSHKRLREVEQKNHDSLITRHEISAEAAASYAKQLDLFENFQKTLVSLSDMLHLDMPNLPTSDKVSRIKETKSSSNNNQNDDISYDQGPWESEESKKFYETLPDLKDFLPSALLAADAQSIKSSSSNVASPDVSIGSDAENAIEKSGESLNDSSVGSPVSIPSVASDSEAVSTISIATQASATSAQGGVPDSLVVFFEKLQRCSNRQLIDDAALEFVRFNQKSWRTKLAMLMHSSARNRLDVLRYFSRFVAILYPYFKDIGVTLVKRLEEEFYFLSRQKDQTNSPSKIWNARFLAELTKFRVCPPNTVLNFLKQCLDDFIGYNVHVACELVDSCGRWLVNLPETRVRASNLLDHMTHLKNTKSFHVTLEILIDNALQTARPPERVVKVAKQIPPIHQYIQRLLFLELRKDNVAFIVGQLKKLHWTPSSGSNDAQSIPLATSSTPSTKSTTSTESDETFLLKTMLKVYKNKYQHISLVASIISQVSAAHDTFGVKFLDHLLEEIRRDLDARKFNNHQKLVMNVSLVGELINHKLADHKIFYKLLYSFIRYNTITAGPKHGGPTDFTFKASIDSSSKIHDPFSTSSSGLHALGASLKEQQREIAAQTHMAWVEDSFRVRLVCTLLTTCRNLSCFPLFHDTQTGRMYARDLETFLIFFQRFLFAQRNITPELNSLLDDTWYLVQPPYLLHSVEEADAKLKKIIASRSSVDGLEERFSLPYKITTSSNASQLAEDEDEADAATDASQTDSDDNSIASPVMMAEDSTDRNASDPNSKKKNNANETPTEEDELAKMFDTMLVESMASRPNLNTRGNSIFSVPLMALKRKAEVIKQAPTETFEIPAIDHSFRSSGSTASVTGLSKNLSGVQISKSSSELDGEYEDGEEENEESDFEADDGESEDDNDGENDEIEGEDDGDDTEEEDDEEEDDEEDISSDEDDFDGTFSSQRKTGSQASKPQPSMQFQFLARKPGNKPVMGAIAIPLESNMVKRHLHAQDVAMKQREVMQAVTMKLHRMGEEADAKRGGSEGAIGIVSSMMMPDMKVPQPVSYSAAVEALTSSASPAKKIPSTSSGAPVGGTGTHSIASSSSGGGGGGISSLNSSGTISGSGGIASNMTGNTSSGSSTSSPGFDPRVRVLKR